MTTRWMVTGARGLLGSQVVAALVRLRPADHVTAVDRAELDLTDRAAVDRRVPGHDVVVSCAAWTDVDRAEGAGEVDARAVNADAARFLAHTCADAGARLLHLSTDYVFDGARTTPYPEDAEPRPLSVYAATKRDGELAVLAAGGCVVRTAWLHDGDRRPSFVATMAARARDRVPSEVVDDQLGQPTWVVPLADRLVALGTATGPDGVPPDGVLHLTAGGATSWCGLARAVYALCGADPELVTPTTTARIASSRPAPRPRFSVLADTRSSRYGVAAMPSWSEALAASLGSGRG